MNHPLYYFTSFVAALFFIMIGLICTALPWLAGVKMALVNFIAQRSLLLFIVGLLLILIGSVIIASMLFNRSKRSYYVRKGNHSFEIDKNVITTYVKIYLDERFPNEQVPHQISIKKDSLTLAADLPYVSKEEQEPFTEKIYEELSQLLKDKVGTEKDLHLSISFPESPEVYRNELKN